MSCCGPAKSSAWDHRGYDAATLPQTVRFVSSVILGVVPTNIEVSPAALCRSSNKLGD